LPESWTAQRQQLPQAPPLHRVPATVHPWPWLNNRQQTTNGCPFPFDCMTCAPEIAAPHTSPQTHEAAGRFQVRARSHLVVLNKKYFTPASSQTPKKSLETLYRMDV
jgi:hypothetical protein